MKRLWYVDIQERGEAFLVKAVNVFDGCEADEPVSARAATLSDAEAILRALKPFCRIPRRYMEINGFGSLLRIASLPKTPLDELVAHTLGDPPPVPPSVLVTPFLTRDEVAWCLGRRHEGLAAAKK
jgi:hypothetical protein